MALFLRDKFIRDVLIDESSLIELVDAFTARFRMLQLEESRTDDELKKPHISFILRFDNKGYRFFTIDSLLNQFRNATYIERLIISVETSESLRTNRAIGSYLELRLDHLSHENSFIQVSSDNEEWVSASFSSVEEVLEKHGTKNGLARSVWATLSVQLLGVVFGFGLSLWAALKISEKLSIENAFIITFLFVLLLFSNTWTYLNQALIALLHKTFPSIHFYRPKQNKLIKFVQALIIAVAGSATVFALGQLFGFIGEFINSLLK